MSMMNLTVARGILVAAVTPPDARRPSRALDPVTLPVAKRPAADAKGTAA